MSSRRPLVVIGGGTAGSLVAAQLAASTARDIVVVEPGVPSTHDDNIKFLDGIALGQSLEAIEVRAASGGRTSLYSQARVVGGGSAINGLLLSGEEPEFVRGLTRIADEADMGPMARALLATGGRPCRLWWNGGRWNPGRALLHLVDEGRVTLLREAATEIRLQGGAQVVSTTDSDLEADGVVVTAGAIRTPELLLRSGLGAINNDIGRGLQNHPTLTVAFEVNGEQGSYFDASVVREVNAADGGQLLLISYERASSSEPNLALLSVSLMNPESKGSVSLAERGTTVDFNMLSTEVDRSRMRTAARMICELAGEKSFMSVSSGAFADDEGTSTDQVLAMGDSDIDEWIAGALQMVSHATSSCRYAVDRHGRLRGADGVMIADASVLAGIPSCTPAAPVTMEALRIARGLGEVLR